jgi:hypothetical protein
MATRRRATKARRADVSLAVLEQPCGVSLTSPIHPKYYPRGEDVLCWAAPSLITACCGSWAAAEWVWSMRPKTSTWSGTTPDQSRQHTRHRGLHVAGTGAGQGAECAH